MTTPSKTEPGWGDSYRLIASDKWKAKSAAMGKAVTDALVEYAQPKPGMSVLDLASGAGDRDQSRDAGERKGKSLLLI